ncbi:hypothetical protein NP233_g7558 [Leucocoprinus birnbaumii]|uniref:Uncharacterized protein n=1 Tax=Leucocoprinus birnbaumii TaxID=56174 RepID=A0AAD5VUH1_9AGAR|nr:hypothetical protein NP233_g7558 [Leucocoprinus birnbaumii]
MRRHGMGQNALVKRKPKKHNPRATAVTNPIAKDVVHAATPKLEEDEEDELEARRRDNVPLDNVLDADTYDRKFRQGDGGQPAEREYLHEPRKMKFYRPGDPDHQAVRPITNKFRQKYSALDDLNKLQNQFIQCLFPAPQRLQDLSLLQEFSASSWARNRTRTYDGIRYFNEEKPKTKATRNLKLGFLSSFKRQGKEHHSPTPFRKPHRKTASRNVRVLNPPNTQFMPAFYQQEHGYSTQPPIQYQSSRSDRRNGKASQYNAAADLPTLPSLAPVRDHHWLPDSKDRPKNLREPAPGFGAPIIYPPPPPLMASRSNPRPSTSGPQDLYPHPKSRSQKNAQSLVQPTQEPMGQFYTPQPYSLHRSSRRKRHTHSSSSQGPLKSTTSGSAHQAVTKYEHVPAEGIQPMTMVVTSHAEHRSQPGSYPKVDQLSRPPTKPVEPNDPPVIPTHFSPNHTRQSSRPAQQTWDIWQPERQRLEHTETRSHPARERTNKRVSYGASQAAPPAPPTAGHRDIEKPAENRQSSTNRPSSSAHRGSTENRGRTYDRKLGELAAEKRAPKPSKKRPSSAETSNPAAANAPMKFYRPGDPNHPSTKPISSDFKRRHAYTLGGAVAR